MKFWTYIFRIRRGRPSQRKLYHLHAFICGVGCVHEESFEGMVDLMRIVMMRPDDCRYAVVTDEAGRVLSVDLLDLQTRTKDIVQRVMAGMLAMPEDLALGRHTEHATVDAAIMSTTLTYEREG